METGIQKAIERAAIAGRLMEAARQYEETGASLRRAAARYRAGVTDALAGISADGLGETARPAGLREWGSVDPADGNG